MRACSSAWVAGPSSPKALRRSFSRSCCNFNRPMSVRAPSVSPAKLATLRMTPLSCMPCLIWLKVFECTKRLPVLYSQRPVEFSALVMRDPRLPQLMAPPLKLESPMWWSLRAHPPRCGDSAA
uniref:Viral protein n=1 Tax=Fowl adenovirus A serotype 1 (strain CELO / Phelps) TaxID=10553 RepID=Q96584_ADEG1|nr:viral protein [Fowl aviadenovirus 1]